MGTSFGNALSSKWNRFFTKMTSRNIEAGIIMIPNFINLVVYLLLYPIIPILLNYPPGMVGDPKTFQMSAGISYSQTFLIFLIFVTAISVFLLRRFSHGINEWERDLATGEASKIRALERKCINIPYLIYMIQIIIPVMMMLLLEVSLLLLRKPAIATTIKVIVLIFSFQTLSAVISQIFSKQLLKRILLKTGRYDVTDGIRISIKTKIFLQVLPMVIVAVLFTSLVGYSKLIDEKGKMLFDIYKNQLRDEFSSKRRPLNITALNKALQKIDYEHTKDCHFIITPGGKVITSNGKKLDAKFLIYLQKKAPLFGGKVQESTGEMLGVVYEVNNHGDKWLVGVRFTVYSAKMLTFFVWSFIALLALNFLVLYYFSKSMANDISQVASHLQEIATCQEIDLSKKIPVTSNDEIGDLVIAFNMIQAREEENIREIQKNQTIIMEQERLASLGQLIGGIAHNLRTPIMSISGSIDALRALVREYQESIDDPQVTLDDHKDIGKEMQFWLDNIKPHCAYMSDVLTAVKGQAVQMSVTTTPEFTIDEVIKRTELLMNFELKKCECTLKTKAHVPLQQVVRGELSSLVQVITNLIVNSVHAYGAKGGVIDFVITREPGKIVFSIRDYAGGIPREIQNRLFKEMVTTKGNQGTGLGLYISYATIKGRFRGELRFESAADRGTTFYVSIPTNESD